MNRYLAYFDILGYKEFLLKNDHDYLHNRVSHIIRDMEIAVGNGRYVDIGLGRVGADLSENRIHMMIYSDTILFYTPDDSPEMLPEILRVAHAFNWNMNLHNMPIRGCLYHGELTARTGRLDNPAGAIYQVSTMYGKGIVHAHQLAESLSFAGTVIDDSVIGRIQTMDMDPVEVLHPFAKPYNIRSKIEDWNGREMYVCKIIGDDGLNAELYKNTIRDIKGVFSKDKKTVDNPRVQEILQNSLDFLATFVTPEEA